MRPGILALALVAALSFLASPANATALVDLEAESVTFELVGSTWKVHADMNIQSQLDIAWSYSFTVKQYRANNLVGTITSGTIEVGSGGNGCTIMCNGMCFVGDKRGYCYWGTPCGCKAFKRSSATLASPQAGDVFVLELTTAEEEYSSTNNSAQATF